ncbi:MAG: hypothetical protein DHS20C10_07160 [marine bacterium B5-7]|nr:MAG: hypothetical protein DHS20C10_07160 [marine bacterium B5-7]
MKSLSRPIYLQRVNDAFTVHPAVALLGPRQCGKTTLARQYAAAYEAGPVHFFDLEDDLDLARLAEPRLALAELEGLIVIDEIQRRPELFTTLRVLIDCHAKQHFLILGSASRDLIQQSSETLAGRIEYIELTPFTGFEGLDLDTLWLRGGFPLSMLADSEQASLQWRNAYIKTYLERDIPNLGFNLPPQILRRFWMMLTHYHTKMWNSADIARSLMISGQTARRYLDILTGTFMLRELQPWHENINKRQVRTSKVYFRDTGIFHVLLGVTDKPDIKTHPFLGASWEGFALEQIILAMQVDPESCFFWGVHQQGELDLLIFKDGKRLGFEIKHTAKPSLTKSMCLAADVLKLDQLTVISPGDHDFPLAENMRAMGLKYFLSSNLR